MNNPLLDKEFLKQLDECKHHTIFAKVIALRFDEEPIEEITGEITSGSINIDGTSAVRRSCSLSMVAKNINITNYYWGLNTKFKLSIGLKNTINSAYPDIIWFKQGVYLITSFSTSQSTNSCTISLQGKDKMCLLNGDIGGVIPSLTWTFGTMEVEQEDGRFVKEDIPVKDIIRDAVHTFAKEPFHNIIINDIDEYGLELLEYRGEEPMYFIINKDSDEVENSTLDKTQKWYTKSGKEVSIESDEINYDKRISLDLGDSYITNPTALYPTLEDASNDTRGVFISKVEQGETCGYRLTDVTYAGDLIGNAGESITSCCLDKIVSMLGEFEYFYDLDGRFIFQKKKTYVNTAWNNIVNNTEEEYIYPAAYTSSVSYHFENGTLITSYQNSPNLANLKNDFSIWGTRKGLNGKDIPVHLRYAIDLKPCYYKSLDGKIYLTQEEYDRKLQEEEEARQEMQDGNINTPAYGESKFKRTPVPFGMNKDWWEIGDWTRRYLYYADIDNKYAISQGVLNNNNAVIDYYNGLSDEKVQDIVMEAAKEENPPQGSFSYYLKVLNSHTLGAFGQTWQYENWLEIFPKPSNNQVPNASYLNYYSQIEVAKSRGLHYWVYLFDTALTTDDEPKEYIRSIEHGAKTQDAYPSSAPGCSHNFTYALTRKNSGANQYYHSYIYNPQIPNELKDDLETGDKVDEEKQEEISIADSNYLICDWREIIYRMAKDYTKYHQISDNKTNEQNEIAENFTSLIARNNPNYYPTGYTGYEHYYVDMEGFWRELYNPDCESIDNKPDNKLSDSTIYYVDTETHIPDTDILTYYEWDKTEKTMIERKFKDITHVIEPNKDAEYFLKKGNQHYPLTHISSDETYYNRDIAVNLTSISENTFYYKENPSLEDDNYNNFKCWSYDINGNKLHQIDSTDSFTTKIIGGEKVNVPNKVTYFEPGRSYYIYNGFTETTTFSIGQNFYRRRSKNPAWTDDELAEISDQVVKGNPSVEYNPTNGLYTLAIETSTDKYYFLQSQVYNYINIDLNAGFSVSTGINNKQYYSELKDGVYEYTLATKNKNGVNYTDCITFYSNKEYAIGTQNTSGSITYTLAPTIKQNRTKDLVYYVIDEKDATNGKIKKATKVGVVLAQNTTTYYLKQKELDSSKQYTYSLAKFFSKGCTYKELTENDVNKIGSASKTFTIQENEKYYIFYGFKRIANLVDLMNTSHAATSEKLNTASIGLEPIYYYIDNNSNCQYDSKLPIGYCIYAYTPVSQDNVKETERYWIYRGTNLDLKADSFIQQYVLKSFNAKNTYSVHYELVDQSKEQFSPVLTYYTKTGNEVYRAVNISAFNPSTQYFLRDRYTLVNTEVETFDEKTIYYKYNNGAFTEYSNLTKFDAGVQYYIRKECFTDINIFDFIDKNIRYYLTGDFNLESYWNLKLAYPETLNFWFDFLDSDGELSSYSVSAVGDRPKAVNDNDVKAIYYRNTPTVIFVNSDKWDKEKDIKPGYTYVKLSKDDESLFTISAQGKTAKDQLDRFLYDFSYCTESISLSTVPIYYLEPNTRIFVHDDLSNIDGEYLISRLTIPLGHSGTMSISATKAVESIY